MISKNGDTSLHDVLGVLKLIGCEGYERDYDESDPPTEIAVI